MVQASAQSQIFKEFDRARFRFRALEAADHLRQQYVFKRREFRQQMMGLIDESDFIAPNAGSLVIREDRGRAPFDIDVTVIGVLKQTRDVEQCRFAGA